MSKLTWYGEEVDKAAQVVSLADAKECEICPVYSLLDRPLPVKFSV